VSPYLTAGPISFGAWVSPTNSADGVILAFNTAAGGDVYELGFDATDDRFFFADTGLPVETSALATDEWHHVMVVIDPDDSGTLYVDGEAEASFTTADRPTEDGQFSIGQKWAGNTPGHFFHGRIDEVVVFDRALTQLEIQELKLGHYNTADYFVRPGDPLYYRASVKNELFNRYAQGLLSVDFPASASEVAPEDFILNPQEQLVMTGTVSVAETAASGVYSLTQEVDAMITDWREASNYAELLYHFTEATPEFEDSSGSQPPRPGDCTACPASTTGRYGNGLLFDGADDYVYNDSVSQYLTGDMLTFGAWVSPTIGGGRGAILVFNTDGGGNRNTLLFDGSTDRFLYRDDGVGSVTSQHAFTRTMWYHVMVVIDPDDNGTLYVNGEAEASFASSVRPAADGTFSVGQEWDGGSTSEHFEGRIDEVVVLNRALSEDAVKTYYSAPVFDLPLDEPAGADRFEDASGFGNDAVCEGDACPSAGEGGITSDSFSSPGTITCRWTGPLSSTCRAAISPSPPGSIPRAGRPTPPVPSGPSTTATSSIAASGVTGWISAAARTGRLTTTGEPAAPATA